MRVAVANRTAQILPVIDRSRLRLKLGRFLVAVGTWNRDVPAGQSKMGFLMFGEAEGRRLVPFQIMAALASIEVRSGCKLVRVPVAMAVGATLEFDFE